MSQNELDDGLPVREAGRWTEDKLAIVRDYLRAFGRACSKRAHSVARTIRGLQRDESRWRPGDRARKMAHYQHVRVVGGDGFEPPTPAL